MQFLVEKGSDIFAKNKKGKAPFEIAELQFHNYKTMYSEKNQSDNSDSSESDTTIDSEDEIRQANYRNELFDIQDKYEKLIAVMVYLERIKNHMTLIEEKPTSE